MAAVSCLLSGVKGYVCTIIVHLWIEATPATVLILVITVSEDKLNICMMKFSIICYSRLFVCFLLVHGIGCII